MRGRPDYGNEPPEYAAGFTETLSHLTDEELAWVCDPREGVQTRCKFLPTPADVFEVIRDRRARLEAVRIPKSSWPDLVPDRDEPLTVSEVDRRKAHVLKVLGYNPARPSERVKPPLTEATAEDLAALKLKTPAGPITRQLREHLAAEGWFDAIGMNSGSGS
jgi:hypothetical protein